MTALRNAYELIRDPERWTVDADARDANGDAVDPLERTAVRWCANGALRRCGADPYPVWRVAKDAFPDVLFNLISVNDDFGHEAVMQVFEKALVETEGGL